MSILDKTLDFFGDTSEKVVENVVGLVERFSNAWEASKQGTSRFDKIKFFFAAFMAESEELTKEEQEVKDKASEEVGKQLLAMPDDQLTSSLKTSVVGDAQLDAKHAGVVDEVLGVATATWRQADKEAVENKKKKPGVYSGEIAKLLSALDPANKEFNEVDLGFDDKLKLISFGVKTLVNLKKEYSEKSEFLDAMKLFHEASKGGKYNLDFFKDPKLAEKFKVSGLQKLSAGKWLLTTISPILNKGRDEKDLVNIMDYIPAEDDKAPESGNKVPALSEISAAANQDAKVAAAVKHAEALKPLFINTPVEYADEGPSLSKMLIILADLQAGKSTGDTHTVIADLVFSVHTDDLETLSNRLS